MAAHHSAGTEAVPALYLGRCLPVDNRQGNFLPAMRLAVLSLVLAILAVAGSELLARRMRKQLGV